MAELSDAEIAFLRSVMKGFTSDEWRALKSFASYLVAARGGSTATGGSSSQHQDDLSDSFLDSQPWTDREITKNPRRWAGDSMAGYRYSEAPSDWLEMQASALEFKAMKGREQPSPRLNNKGKPWHEVDAFEAKICRAWARRNRGKDLPPQRAKGQDAVGADVSDQSTGDAYEEEFVP